VSQHEHVVRFEDLHHVLWEVEVELKRAEKMYPLWPGDVIHGAAIMAEEAGEAVQAALQLTYGNGARSTRRAAYRKELVHTAAMCARAILDLDAEAIAKEEGK